MVLLWPTAATWRTNMPPLLIWQLTSGELLYLQVSPTHDKHTHTHIKIYNATYFHSFTYICVCVCIYMCVRAYARLLRVCVRMPGFLRLSNTLRPQKPKSNFLLSKVDRHSKAACLVHPVFTLRRDNGHRRCRNAAAGSTSLSVQSRTDLWALTCKRRVSGTQWE